MLLEERAWRGYAGMKVEGRRRTRLEEIGGGVV
jgi:hypothetical protein